MARLACSDDGEPIRKELINGGMRPRALCVPGLSEQGKRADLPRSADCSVLAGYVMSINQGLAVQAKAERPRRNSLQLSSMCWQRGLRPGKARAAVMHLCHFLIGAQDCERHLIHMSVTTSAPSADLSRAFDLTVSADDGVLEVFFGHLQWKLSRQDPHADKLRPDASDGLRQAKHKAANFLRRRRGPREIMWESADQRQNKVASACWLHRNGQGRAERRQHEIPQ